MIDEGPYTELAEQIGKIADLLRTELLLPSTELVHSLATARTLRQLSDEAVVVLVASARERGVSWQLIGEALGTSRQAAFQRFGTPIDPRTGMIMERRSLPEATDRAVALLAAVAAHRWNDAVVDFGPMLVKGLTPDGLAEAYASLVAIGGALERQGEPQVVALAGATVVEVALHHEAADFLGRISFGPDGKIVGLWFLPAPLTASLTDQPGQDHSCGQDHSASEHSVQIP